MPNRSCRDELIYAALEMAQVPNLKAHDMPNGVVNVNAFSITWLQDIMDFWYHICPFSSTVSKIPYNLLANTQDYSLPDDFILDVKHGLVVQNINNNSSSKQRKLRLPLQKWISRDLSYQGQTSTTCSFYVIHANQLHITPIPNENKNAWLWYYQLPAPLNSDDVPIFPNDYVIKEYLRIRALEWVGRYDPGTAQKFCDKIVVSMKANGLMNEPEDDEIELDQNFYVKGYNPNFSYQWMGSQ